MHTAPGKVDAVKNVLGHVAMSQALGSAAGENILAYAPAGDFRLGAAAASRALLNDRDASHAAIDPEDAASLALSLCLPVTDAPSSAAMCRLRRVATACGGIGFGAVVLTLTLMGAAAATDRPELIVIALALSLAGLILQLVDLYWRIAMIRSVILRRLSGSARPSVGPAPCVSIEDARTFLLPKPVGEDVALLWCDPERRRICVEGFTYRYFVHAADLVRVRVRRTLGTCGTEIRYRIGATELAIVISEYSANPLELCMVLLSVRSRLRARIVAAIGTGAAPPRTVGVSAGQHYT